MWELAVPVSIGVVVILVIGLMLAKLYRRSTRDEAYVRTGLGGQKVVLDGGSLVLPVFHSTAAVNLKPLQLNQSRFNHCCPQVCRWVYVKRRSPLGATGASPRDVSSSPPLVRVTCTGQRREPRRAALHELRMGTGRVLPGKAVGQPTPEQARGCRQWLHATPSPLIPFTLPAKGGDGEPARSRARCPSPR